MESCTKFLITGLVALILILNSLVSSFKSNADLLWKTLEK